MIKTAGPQSNVLQTCNVLWKLAFICLQNGWSQYRLKMSSNPCFVLSTSAPSCSSPLSSTTRGSTTGSEAFSSLILSCSAMVNSADSCSGVTRVVMTPAGTKSPTHACLLLPAAACRVVPFTPHLPRQKTSAALLKYKFRLSLSTRQKYSATCCVHMVSHASKLACEVM